MRVYTHVRLYTCACTRMCVLITCACTRMCVLITCAFTRMCVYTHARIHACVLTNSFCHFLGQNYQLMHSKKGVSPRIWAVFSDFYQSREQNRGGGTPPRAHTRGGQKVSIHRGSWHVLVALLTEFAKKRLFCSDFGLIVRKFCVLYGKKIPQFWPKTSKFSFKIRGVFLVEFCPKSGKIVKFGLKKASFFEKNVFFSKNGPWQAKKTPDFSWKHQSFHSKSRVFWSNFATF